MPQQQRKTPDGVTVMITARVNIMGITMVMANMLTT